jgi:hypothetical protein
MPAAQRGGTGGRRGVLRPRGARGVIALLALLGVDLIVLVGIRYVTAQKTLGRAAAGRLPDQRTVGLGPQPEFTQMM